MQINSIFKEFENLSVEKITLSTALGFEPRSFDCRSTALERPGLESQRSRKRHFFHRKIFKFFKYFLNYYSFSIFCQIGLHWLKHQARLAHWKFLMQETCSFRKMFLLCPLTDVNLSWHWGWNIMNAIAGYCIQYTHSSESGESILTYVSL